MLQHKYMVSKIGIDTAENGPSTNWVIYPSRPRPGLKKKPIYFPKGPRSDTCVFASIPKTSFFGRRPRGKKLKKSNMQHRSAPEVEGNF